MHIVLPDDDLTLLAGTAGSVRVTVVRNGFEGQLRLRAEGVPSGVLIPDVLITSEEVEGLLAVTATDGAIPGNSDIAIRAEGDSVETSIRTLHLTIRPPGSFALSADPIGIVPASSASTSASVVRLGGFTGTVTLSVSAPVGLVASVQPAQLSGNATTALLTVEADRSIRPGAYTLRLMGTSPGFVDQVIELIVTVSGV
jgi:hypothetical protein